VSRGIALLPHSRAPGELEAEFVRRLRRHDADAWHELFESAYDRVFADAWMLTGDSSRAAAVAAHVFVEAPSRAGRLGDVHDVAVLLAELTRREARRGSRNDRAIRDDPDAARLARAWSGLGIERWILLARLDEGRLTPEVAATVGMGIGETQKKQFQGLRDLARRLPEARI
jgi:hypothetical protein